MPVSRSWFAYLKAALQTLLLVGLLSAALWAAGHEFKQMTADGLSHALRKLSFLQVAKAAVLTLLSFLLLTTYDMLGARYARLRMSRPFVMLVSFIAYTITMNVGFGSVTGSSVRYRFYTRWGVSAADVLRVVAFCGTTFWMGFTMLAGWALWTGEASHLGRLSFLAPYGPALGALLEAIVAGYVLICFFWRGSITIRGEHISPPAPFVALAQPFLGTVDWILSASVFYVLLPHGTPLTFSTFLHAYLLAQMAGMLSHVPGGLGVFEGLLLFGLGGAVDPQALAASIVAFRCIYYLAPLVVSIVAMVAVAVGEGSNSPRP